jgi:hypothetical protein
MFHGGGQTSNLQLERVALKSGLQVWLVSADSVDLIPKAHQLIAENWFEKKLPQLLVTIEILDTPVWRWIALILMGALIWMMASLVARAAVKILRRWFDAGAVCHPLRALLAVVAFRVALEIAPPSAIPRLFIERALGLVFSLALAWGAALAVDLFASRWHSRLDPRVQAVTYSVLPLAGAGRRCLPFRRQDRHGRAYRAPFDAPSHGGSHGRQRAQWPVLRDDPGEPLPA